ncbi:DNA_methylase domain-containing protein/Chromo domain-containing protein/BAH domain-containing protein [Cephalotus follicularis]|uniref:Cytosine-specific methyltransferase n=1 Tax=Cephalotus follicularis TaxID=3775 RepID=A0A1Q3ASS0_CEPFO|nr:DNA_methylase domain-containing protein/Chromo domain-containing protein/BAH domain-containing protein [Cephalotus follicularis]
MESPRETKSESPCFTLLENGSEQLQSLPVEINDPNMTNPSPSKPIVTLDVGPKDTKSPNKFTHQKYLRRSPRNKSSTESKVFDEVSLRRSPRFVSSNGRVECTLIKSKNGDNKCIRRSPRFASSSIGERNATVKSASKSKISKGRDLTMKADVKRLEKKSLRQSPRRSSTLSTPESIHSKTILGSPEKGWFGGLLPITSNLEMSSLIKLKAEPLSPTMYEEDDERALPSTYYDPVILDENHLGNNANRKTDNRQLRRSPRLSSDMAGAENVTVNSTLIRVAGLSEERSSKKIKTISGNSDTRLTEETFLRQLPLLILATDTDGINEPLRKYDVRFSDEKILRESPKLSLSVSNLSDEQPSKNFKIALENSDMETLFGAANGSIKGQRPEKLKISAISEEKPKKRKKRFSFIGDPIPDDEAQKRWCWRYELKSQGSKGKGLAVNDDDDDDEDKIISNAECHYNQVEIDGCIFDLGDCAYIKGERGQKHVGMLLEFFRTTDKEDYFRVQWFYRAEDTVMKEAAASHDKKRLFSSTIMNDNPVDCIISKVSVTQISPGVGLNSISIPPSDFYFDMEYSVDYSTFRTLSNDDSPKCRDSLMPRCTENVPAMSSGALISCEPSKAELVLLDLYSGCGGMSTGLCLGAKASRIDLVTRWALDSDRSTCESLKLNHPETNVWNESAEDFLELLKEWEKLCNQYVVNDVEGTGQSKSVASRVTMNDVNSLDDDDDDDDDEDDDASNEYEVADITDICFGDPSETGKRGLKLKVHWKGYETSEDSWEPVEELSNCQERIRDFVRNGFRSKILPLPGDVDVICGGPPCQGISGYNRFRNAESPLADERNRQIIVFMDIVQFLKPKFVLMENVVDILRFDKASLARYALSRLVHMRYQARLGTIAAGCYGLPQFRLRVFLWGAHPNEKLPQFPLPTHDVIVRYWPPPEWERNTVAYNEDQPRELEKAIVLQDAISDLPAVTSHEIREEMSYEKPPESEFQRYIRSTKHEMGSSLSNDDSPTENLLYDHRPYSTTEEDYARVCLIPKRKGANFRDLPGVEVGTDNVVRRKEKIFLPSGKPMVPDYALTFEQGKSKRPFARLWWDETVPTVVTFPNLHSQAAIHPEQDRVLTIREYARLQGFPDYYRFRGSVKKRYRQLGNAVAVPVARALGYSLGMAYQKLSGNEPLMTLPPKFSLSTNHQLAKSLFKEKSSATH